MSKQLGTPSFIMYQEKLTQNLEHLKRLEKLSNVHILHTLKSFNEASVTPFIAQAISGMSISSRKELDMAKKAKAKHIHLYAPAFKEELLNSMVEDVQTLSLNSLGQWHRFKEFNVSTGLRINPELSLLIPSHCNPNLKSSRLGVPYLEFLSEYHDKPSQFQELEGLHFHALFQSSVEGISTLLAHIMQHYKEVLPQLKWLNLGGGHNFTNANYDINTFVKEMNSFQKLYPNIKFYFEPGEAVTKGCGEFVCSVLDIVNIGRQKVVILDTSVETHLLDVAIVNIKPKLKETQSEPSLYSYELTGNSCLQGDSIGQYFFTKALNIGDHVVFENMMSYTMVKMTEFNGMENARFYME